MRIPFLSTLAVLSFQCFAAASEVRDFGAIGDGVADDSDAVQAAVDAGWGSVRFEKGTYRLTKTITVKLNEGGPLSLVGDGTARIVMAGAGPAFRIVGTHGGTADPGSVKAEVFAREMMPLVDGLEIVGAHAEADGIEAKGTMQLTITRVNVRDCRHAIHLVERNRNLIVSNCHLYRNRGIGIFYDAVNLHQSNITGCHISYNAGGGVVSRGGEVRNVQIAGCDIESNMAAGAPPSANVTLDSRGGSIAEVAITGCTLQHTGKVAGSANVHIIGPGEDKRAASESGPGTTREGNVTISANVMSDVRVNVHIEHARGVTILGNTFWEGFDHDLLVEHSSEIAVTGNVFDRNPRYELFQKEKPKQGLVFSNCADCTLSGVHINGVRGHDAALQVKESSRFLITGCSVLDSDGDGILLENVRQSRVGLCLIADDRTKRKFQPIAVKGGEGNVTDAR
ncbi:MAG: right-handed parallel beta-helix repeat-containing protein [Chthoniobacteraceae bacterium]